MGNSGDTEDSWLIPCEGSCVRGAPTLHVMHSFILCVVAFISYVSREHDIDSFVDLCALRV